MLTKNYIADAFVEASRKKGLDKVTVRDIAEGCDMARQTFYYYFDDIPDLLMYMIRQKTEKIMHQVQMGQDTQLTLNSFVELVDENDYFVRKLHNSRYHDITDRILFQFLCDLLTELTADSAVSQLPRREREFIISYNAYAVKDILVYWRRENNADTKEAIMMIRDFVTDKLGKSELFYI